MWSTFRDASPRFADTDPRGLLTAYLDEAFRPRDGIDAVGFKLMDNQAAAIPSLPDVLRAQGVVVVHVVRRNSLDVVLSMELARLSGRWHARSDGPVEPRVISRFSLPVEGLVEPLPITRRFGRGSRRSAWGISFASVPGGP